jgi:ABC-type multidrug transport system fused ATPase/permease subunit
MDEATANVDSDTDVKIQRAITGAFKDQTLLCIAHRIDTIMSYDRVAVLDDGHVLEVGPPAELAKDPSSAFSQIANATRA